MKRDSVEGVALFTTILPFFKIRRASGGLLPHGSVIVLKVARAAEGIVASIPGYESFNVVVGDGRVNVESDGADVDGGGPVDAFRITGVEVAYPGEHGVVVPVRVYLNYPAVVGETDGRLLALVVIAYRGLEADARRAERSAAVV